MRVLLASTYELGRQPLHLAIPASRLQADGVDVVTVDLAVEEFDPVVLDTVDAVAISVPMHTAMVLGRDLARSIRRQRPDVPIAFYGLYAAVSSDATIDGAGDAVFGGEYLEPLADWVAARGTTPSVRVTVGRPPAVIPARAGLPPLDAYAHLALAGEHRLVGAVEATVGCRHHCRHCPLPAVYGGRFRPVDIEMLRADADQLVALGARHITFGDPDFLNGPAHARRVLAAIGGDHPDLTFDVTVKVEHILAWPELWPELAAANVVLAVSAFESVDDATLVRLDKGHTVADMSAATAVVRDAGIELRPTWLPFTPWTTREQMVDLFAFVDEHRLWGSIDPVQLSIRLLIPEGSLLLDLDEVQSVVGEYDPGALSYPWSNPDPSMDELQRSLARIAEDGAAGDDDPFATLRSQSEAVQEVCGPVAIPHGSIEGRPRLTEPWFC